MSDAAILLIAAGFIAMGLGALARPREVVTQFGGAAETIESRNEIRAVYGGFGLATAALLAVAAIGDPATAEGIVVAVAFSLCGMAGGRALSALEERPRGFFPVWLYFTIEVVGAAVLLAAAWA